ncbi:MAG: hypothetical protein ACYDBJ_26065 [Aggregatilineales bacterium]
MNKRPDEPRSLLRRLLRQADRTPAPSVDVPAGPPTSASLSTPVVSTAPPAPLPSAVHSTSPIRPPTPPPPPPPAPVTLAPPRGPAIPSAISSPAERLQAEAALEELRHKTAHVASEFAEGKINRAQFSSMYAYYNEKRIIIEQLLRRDPDTQAWQSVARAGHTGFLRQHFEARVIAFGVYDAGTFEPFVAQGTVTLPGDVIQPILTALYIVQRNRKELKPISRKATNGRWLVIVPGTFATAIALFSLEPATQQVALVRDLHYDFERANRRILERGIRQPDQLVFPHRALFEQRAELTDFS